MSEVSDFGIYKAIKLAVDVIVESEEDLSEFDIVKAENLLARGPAFWLITFKLKSILPKKKGGIIGAGGEIFVTAELDTNTAKISGYGE